MPSQQYVCLFIYFNLRQVRPGLIHHFEDGGGPGECDGQQLICGGGGGGQRIYVGGGHRIDFDETSALYILNYIIIIME